MEHIGHSVEDTITVSFIDLFHLFIKSTKTEQKESEYGAYVYQVAMNTTSYS